MRRLIGALLALGLLVALPGCSPSPTAITVNGRGIDAAELAFYLEYNRLNMENKQSSAQLDRSDSTVVEEVKQTALDQITTAEIVLEKCDEFDLQLSDDAKEQLEESKNYLVESHGGKAGYLKFLKESAMTDRVYDKFQSNAHYYDMLYDYLVGDSGKYAYTDEELRQFFADHYAELQYIRLSLQNEDGDDIASSAASQQMAQAKEVLAQAQQPGADFKQLLGLYNDDTYMSANADGVVMTKSQCASTPQFEKLFSMKDNEIGGVFEGPDGYYIVKRLPLSAAYFDQNKDAIQQEARDTRFNELLDEWKAAAKVTTTSIFDKMNLDNLWDYVK